jgi:hypothetical protein
MIFSDGQCIKDDLMVPSIGNDVAICVLMATCISRAKSKAIGSYFEDAIAEPI